MSPDTLLCAASPGEWRLALCAGDRPVELAVLRADHVGAIWLGRVVRVSGGTAFVDIGGERPGVLAEAGLGEGAAILVQGVADPQDDKGAKLTAAPSLVGPLLAFSPFRPGASLSRRIRDPGERARLTRLAAALLAPGEGVVLRRPAAAASDQAIADALAALRAQWAGIAAAAATARPPTLLLPSDPVGRMLADNPGVARILADDDAVFAALHPRFPALLVRQRGCFAAWGIEEALERALDPLVPLPSGGSLVIERTAALVAIDVNAGSGSPAAANHEAAAAVPRELRLRNLAGHILVDFIALRRGFPRHLVEALRAAVAEDPIPTQVIGVSPLGLVELTRERRRAGLADVMLERVLRRRPEAVATAALRAVLAEAAAQPGPLALAAPPAVLEAVRRLPGALAETERCLGRPLPLRPTPGVDGFAVERS